MSAHFPNLIAKLGIKDFSGQRDDWLDWRYTLETAVDSCGLSGILKGKPQGADPAAISAVRNIIVQHVPRLWRDRIKNLLRVNSALVLSSLLDIPFQPALLSWLQPLFLFLFTYTCFLLVDLTTIPIGWLNHQSYWSA